MKSRRSTEQSWISDEPDQFIAFESKRKGHTAPGDDWGDSDNRKGRGRSDISDTGHGDRIDCDDRRDFNAEKSIPVFSMH